MATIERYIFMISNKAMVKLNNSDRAYGEKRYNKEPFAIGILHFLLEILNFRDPASLTILDTNQGRRS